MIPHQPRPVQQRQQLPYTYPPSETTTDQTGAKAKDDTENTITDTVVRESSGQTLQAGLMSYLRARELVPRGMAMKDHARKIGGKGQNLLDTVARKPEGWKSDGCLEARDEGIAFGNPSISGIETKVAGLEIRAAQVDAGTLQVENNRMSDRPLVVNTSLIRKFAVSSWEDQSPITSTSSSSSSPLPAFVTSSRASSVDVSCVSSSSPPSPTYNLLQSRSRTWSSLYKPSVASLPAFAARHIPQTLREREFDICDTDKIFASAWISDSEVACGTKCGKLFVLNIDTGKKVVIPGFKEVHSGGASQSAGRAAVGEGTGSNQSMNSTSATQSQTVNMVRAHHCTGIHSITLNPSRTLLATGSGHPHPAIQIYSLPSFTPYALLQGHTDMVFSVAWVADGTIVSGSRDGTVKVWHVHEGIIDDDGNGQKRRERNSIRGVGCVRNIKPTASSAEFTSRIRDLVVNPFTNETVTLSTDGTVKIWDLSSSRAIQSKPPTTSTPINLAPKTTHSLRGLLETVCLTVAIPHSLYLIGSQNHVSFLDPRVASGVVHEIPSLDDGWGVRSLAVQTDVLAVGGGFGRIAFWDLRGGKYLEWEKASDVDVGRGGPALSSSSLDGGPVVNYHETSAGHLCKDEIYTTHFQGVDIRNAVYSLGWSSDGRGYGGGPRLFVAGGPLQLNLRGTYVGVWS